MGVICELDRPSQSSIDSAWPMFLTVVLNRMIIFPENGCFACQH